MLSIIVEVLIVTLFTAAMATQVVWPIIRGTPMFPLFRRERRLRHEIAEVEQTHIEEDLETELRRMREPTKTKSDEENS